MNTDPASKRRQRTDEQPADEGRAVDEPAEGAPSFDRSYFELLD